MRFVATVVALAIVALAVIAFVPATLVDRQIAQASGGALRLAEAAGTVWHGEGVVVDGADTVRLPLAWSLAAWPLLRGEADVTLRPASRGESARGRLVVRRDGARADMLHASVPASLLTALVATPVPVLAGGELAVDAPSLTLSPTAYAGSATLTWKAARLSLPALPPIALGDVVLPLATEGAALAGPLRSEGGDVGVTGQARLGPDGTSIEIMLAARPGAPPIVARAIALLAGGREGPARIAWRGAPLLR